MSPSSDMSSLVSTSPSTQRSPNRPCRNHIWPWEQDVAWQSLLIDHSHDRFDDTKKAIGTGRADFFQNGMVPAAVSHSLIKTQTSYLPDHTQPLFRADLDPYCVDRNLTVYYIGQFLKHLDPTLEDCIPRDMVMPWVMTCTAKTSQDKMLLYAMLAMGAGAGAGAGQGTRSDKDGHVFASIAHSLLLTTTRHSRSYSHDGHGHGHAGSETTNCSNDNDNDNDQEEPLQQALTRLTLAMLAVSQGRCGQALELCRTSPSRRGHCGVVPDWDINGNVNLDAPRDSPPMTPLPIATWELMLDQDKLLQSRRTVAWCLRLIGSLASSWSVAPRQPDLSSA